MNLPNAITLSRLVFLVVIGWFATSLWTGAATLAFALAIIAASTDWVDGYIARKTGQVTNFGKIADALVDKILVIGLFIILYSVGLLHRGFLILQIAAMAVIVLTAIRDTVITVMRLVATRKGVYLGADKQGKRKTIWQITGICVLFAVPVVARDIHALTGANWSIFADFLWYCGIGYFFYSGYLAISSGVFYVSKYLPVLMGGGNDGNGKAAA